MTNSVEASLPIRPTAAEIGAAILALTAARGPDRSICPSEVARALRPDWHGLMAAVRQEAVRLARRGEVAILRKGRPADLADVKGVIRLRQAPPGEAA